jgi:hypothetical protein
MGPPLATGLVTYDDEMFVRAVGRQASRIPRSVVAQLLTTAECIGSFGLRDANRVIENPDGTRTIVADLPTTIVASTSNARSKQVDNYLGAPDSIAAFERDVDAAAQTTRWVFLDETTVEELLRSGWARVARRGGALAQGGDRARRARNRTSADPGAGGS